MRSCLALAVFAAWCTAAPSDDLFSGTWTMEMSKSSNTGGIPLPKSWVRTYTVVPSGGYKITQDMVRADGMKTSTEVYAGDGKEHTVTNQSGPKTLATATHYRSRRLDNGRLETTFLNNGKKVGVRVTEVSADGKTMIFTDKWAPAERVPNLVEG